MHFYHAYFAEPARPAGNFKTEWIIQGDIFTQNKQKWGLESDVFPDGSGTRFADRVPTGRPATRLFCSNFPERPNNFLMKTRGRRKVEVTRVADRLFHNSPWSTDTSLHLSVFTPTAVLQKKKNPVFYYACWRGLMDGGSFFADFEEEAHSGARQVQEHQERVSGGQLRQPRAEARPVLQDVSGGFQKWVTFVN